MRLYIHTYFPRIIFLGILLITFLPLVVSPETVFPYVVGRSLWFRGIIYCITTLWLLLLWVDRSYIPAKSTLILAFSLFVFFQALAGLFGLSPNASFWSNFERMEGVVEYTHWLIFAVVAVSTIRKKVSWIKILKVNTLVGTAVATLGLLEYFGLVIPLIFNLDLFPLVTTPADSYTYGERVESTIGNPAYLSAYLSLIIFSSFGLVSRDFQINFKKSFKHTYLQLKLTNKIYLIISLIGAPIIFFTIISSGSRGALIGIFAGLLFILSLLTRQWQWPTAATCGLCVTTSICGPLELDKDERRSPTAAAVAPPTPASTSSKINVATLLVPVNTTFRANRMRLSSPPEAIFPMVPGILPGLVAIKNSTVSMPVSDQEGSLKIVMLLLNIVLSSFRGTNSWLISLSREIAAFIRLFDRTLLFFRKD